MDEFRKNKVETKKKTLMAKLKKRLKEDLPKVVEVQSSGNQNTNAAGDESLSKDFSKKDRPLSSKTKSKKSL